MSKIAALSRRSTTSALYRRPSRLVTDAAIRRLYSLGFSQTEILSTLNISRSPRVRNTLQQAKMDFAICPAGSARFTAQLQAFCALEGRKNGGLSEEEVRIHAALLKALGIDNEFFDGMRELALRLATPEPPESDRGCWSLISRLLQDQPRTVFDDYWQYLDRYGVFPDSWAALRADMLRYTVEWCRANAVHGWPQNARMAIEWLLEKIDPQAATIIRQRFGIGNYPALKCKEIGVLHKMTQWRVGKLEVNGEQQLKRVAGKEFLRKIFLKPLSRSPQHITAASLEDLFRGDRSNQSE
jgi:hypothetical protein